MRNKRAVQDSNKHTKCKWNAEITINLLSIGSITIFSTLKSPEKASRVEKSADKSKQGPGQVEYAGC